MGFLARGILRPAGPGAPHGRGPAAPHGARQASALPVRSVSGGAGGRGGRSGYVLALRSTIAVRVSRQT